MSKIAGLLLIAAGVGTAAYVYPLLTSGDDRQVADVAVQSGSAPASRAPVVVVRPASQDAQRTAETEPGRLPFANQAPRAPAMAVVVSETPASGLKPIEPPAPVAARRQSRSDEQERITLTREIQRELIRVGCFDGVADGTWSPETRQAMKQFIDRVNASLPVDDPDHILKTLVQGHPGNACGRACPTGQVYSNTGKCVAPVVASVPKRVPTPQAATREATGPAPKSSSWEPKVVLAPQPAQRPQVAALPEPNPADVKTERVEPLPGRTSLGAAGVQPPSPSTAAADVPVTEAPTAHYGKRPVIVLKPRAGTPNAKPGAVFTAAPQPAFAPAPVAQPLPSAPGTPQIGAVAAIDAAGETTTARATPPGPPPRVATTRPSPQRPVATYAYRERPRFGPQFFRDLDRGAR